MKFGLRPNASGPGAHASLRAQRKREFGDVVAVGGIEDDQQIAVARRKIDLFDLNSHFLGQILSGFGRLGASLIERIPWSVQLSEHMNVGMRSSVWLP